MFHFSSSHFFYFLIFSFSHFSHHHHLSAQKSRQTVSVRRPIAVGDTSIPLFISHSPHFPPFLYSLSIIFLSFSHHQTLFSLTFFNKNYILSLKKYVNFFLKSFLHFDLLNACFLVILNLTYMFNYYIIEKFGVGIM